MSCSVADADTLAATLATEDAGEVDLIDVSYSIYQLRDCRSGGSPQ